MLLSKLLLLFLSIRSTRTSRDDILNPIALSDEKTSRAVVGAVANILASCYETDGLTSLEIVVGGNWPETLLSTLWSRKLIPVTLIEQITRIRYQHNFSILKYKKRIFVISVMSDDHLRQILLRILSLSYNPMGSYIVVLNSPTTKHRCINPNLYIQLSTAYQIINTRVICVDRTRGILVYAYNSYVSYAPVPWEKYKVLYRENRYPVTMYVRNYRENEQICEGWHFDVTKNVTGCEIPVETLVLPENKHIGKGTNSKAYLDINKHIFQTMYDAWKVTPMIFYSRTERPFSRPYNVSLPGSRPFRVLPLISTNPASMRLATKSQMQSVPYSRTGLVIATNFRGHKSQLEKILFVIDKSSRIGLCVVLLLTLVFFKFFVGQTVMSAFLNVVRIVCSTGFEGLPSNTATRMYLTALLIFAVTLQGIYQGDLASLLTHHIPVRNVDTFQNLAESGYTIYGFYPHGRLFTDPIFKNRFVPLGYEDCIEFVIKNSSVACVNTPHVLMDQAATLKLHLSIEYIVERDEVLVLNPAFSLKAKLDWTLRSMVEADIIRPLRLRVKQNTLDDFRFDEMVKSNKHHKALDLSELAFAFALLAIGLIFALVAFIGEIVIYRFQTRIANSRTRVQDLRARRSV